VLRHSRPQALKHPFIKTVAYRKEIGMESDSFFFQLFKQLPQTLFELLGMPAAPSQAKAYRFESVEVKKSLRIDGLFIPRRSSLPLYFLEVQFRREAKFYANLFAKVFFYLEANDPGQEWFALALFERRSFEPEELGPYRELLDSPRVRRVYLDDFPASADPPLGLRILQLASAPANAAPALVSQLLHKAEHELADSRRRRKIVELMEELLIRRFSTLSREEVRAMFKLEDIRKTRVWQEAHGEGRQEGREEGREEGRQEERQEAVRKMLASGLTAKRIAAIMDVPVEEVQRLAKRNS
jgi:predicted transposase/invertase (TIGR01784 family)